MRLLNGYTAIITGAARGLGQAVAKGFSKEGARLILCDRLPIPAIGTAARHKVDLSNRKNCLQFAEDVLGNTQQINILVNNAAILPLTPILSITETEWEQTLAINLTAPFLLSKAFLPKLRKEGGSIINVSSRAGIEGMKNEVSYCASKFGIEGFTKALSTEAGDNVSVNTITPGLRIKPTMMTDDFEQSLKPDEIYWNDASAIVPAFVHLGLAKGNPTGQRFEADKLTAETNQRRTIE